MGGCCFCLQCDYIPASHIPCLTFFSVSEHEEWRRIRVLFSPSLCVSAVRLGSSYPFFLAEYSYMDFHWSCQCTDAACVWVVMRRSLSETGVHGLCVCVHLGVVVCKSCCTACTLVPIKHFAFDALSCGFQAASLVHNPLLHAALASLLKGPVNMRENRYNIHNYSCIPRLH